MIDYKVNDIALSVRHLNNQKLYPIRLEQEKARRRGKVYNWETATYGKIWYDEDVHDLRSVETEFPSIVFNDSLTAEVTFTSGPTVSPLNDNIKLTLEYRLTSPTMKITRPQHVDEFDLKDETSLSECDEEEQNVLYFNYLFPFNVVYPDDLKSYTDNDNDNIDIEQPPGDMSVIPLPNEPYGVFWGLGYAVLIPVQHTLL
uniref:Uncharacterized protein n=1 Tax=Tanacetum cinerariifolium TaxID=118510 RepID=A0A6L2KMF0_TANCI|nr:hypothetical protein [Tanacetum cinerariifolium]